MVAEVKDRELDGSAAGSAPGSGAGLDTGDGNPSLPAATALDSEALFADFPALADLPEIDAIIDPESGAAASGAHRESAEIEALLQASARRARELSGGTAGPAAEEVLVDERMLGRIEALFAADPLPSESTAIPTRATNPAAESAPPGAPTAVFSAQSEHPSAIDRGRVTSEPPPTRAQKPPFVVQHESQPAPDERPSLVDVPAERPTMLDLGQPQSGAEPAAAALERRWGDAIALVGGAISRRDSGALRIASDDGARVRYLLLRDGDIVTASSDLDAESLLAMLVERGDVVRELLRERAARLPRSGPRAAAALIAQGFLGQDELWPVLRSHAEWILGRVLREPRVAVECLPEAPGALGAEPSVFGGATGVEVFVDIVRRVLHPAEAVARLGGKDARIDHGALLALLHEAALEPAEVAAIAASRTFVASDAIARAPDAAALLAALVALDVLRAQPPQDRAGSAGEGPTRFDSLEEGAIRQRVAARMALVREGDYFAVLGVPPDATSYAIRRAYLALRRTFEPSLLLTAATADLGDDVDRILDVAREAYEVLRDDGRRERYRRAAFSRVP